MLESPPAPVSRPSILQKEKIPNSNTLKLKQTTGVMNCHILLSVKTDYQIFWASKRTHSDPVRSQTPAEVAKEKTLGPAKAVGGPPDEAKKTQGHLNGIYGFLRDSEYQWGLGAGIPLSSKMAPNFNPGLWG